MKSRDVVTNRYTAPLTDKGYTVERGWDDDIAAAIVEHSREPHIVQSTPGDASRRFATLEAAQAWHASHQRVIYGLYHAAELAGLIWYSRSPLPHPEADADVTFAIRMYERSRGQKLARPFLQASETDYRNYTGYDDAIWLSTATDNLAAQALYFSSGYDEVARTDERITMTKGGTQ